MDLETFQEKVRDIILENDQWWGKAPPERLTKRWELEGSSGGNYLGGESRYHTGESEPPFVMLDTALERLAPRITLLEYRVLLQEVVARREWRQDEYYGDWTRYAEETVELSALHQWLEKRDLLQP